MRRPFSPEGPTIALTLTTISSAIALSSQTTAGINSGIESARFYNSSTNDAYVWVANSSTGLATTVSSGPYPSYRGYAIPYHQTEVLSVGPNCWISGVTTAPSFTSVLMITPGSGGI